MPDIDTSFSGNTFYRKFGKGPAVVLLHGFPEDGESWKTVWPYLSGKFTIIVPDFPGVGKSAYDADITIDKMADIVKGILEAENIDTAIIVGHSMGGYVASAFADKYPKVVKGLSLVHSTPAPDDDEKKDNRKKVISIIQKGGKETFIKQAIPNLFAPQFLIDNPAVVEAQITSALSVSAESMVSFYNAMMIRPDRSKVLLGATFPIHWMIGKQDNTLSYKKILYLCYRSRINFVTFDDKCGHMSMLEAPHLLQHSLTEFIEYCYKEDSVN